MNALVSHGTSQALVYFHQAKTAVAAAKTADEVSRIRENAEGMRAVAHAAKDRQLEADAAEIRIRAERRLGEMLKAHKESVGLNEGGRPAKTSTEMAPVSEPTLAQMGIDKKLSSHCQRLAEVPDKRFEAKLTDWREDVDAGKGRVVLPLYRKDDFPEADHRPNATRLIPEPREPEDKSGLAATYQELVWVLAAARKAEGYSQQEFDAHLGWTEGQTSKYELPHRDTGRVMGDWDKAWRPFFEYLAGIGYGVRIEKLAWRKA